MATFQNVGDTIEGKKISGNTRKWMQRGLKKHPDTNKNMFLYVTDRNSEAEVDEAGDIPSDEDVKTKTQGYHRSVGDRLECDSMSIYVNQITPIKPEIKEGISGRHGAAVFHIAKQAIATIKMPLANVMKRLGYTSNSIEQ